VAGGGCGEVSVRQVGEECGEMKSKQEVQSEVRL
jgi:hypothetical protein